MHLRLRLQLLSIVRDLATLLSLVLVICCLVAVHVDGDEDVILKPVKYHPIQKLIVYVPGAFVPDYDYTTLSQAIQRECPYQLWVGIPTFTGNFPNPLQLSSKIKGIISVVQQAGFSNMNTSTDVYIAGHSVGGTFAQDVVVSDSYGALILFGSYLLVKSNVPNHLLSYPVPVLTLGAELDGLTRMTRIAVEYTNYKHVVKSTSEQQAILTKPVVILRQITHSQFCAGVNVSGDIVPPEISYAQAHQTIAAVTSAFLENINNATTSSFNLMRTWISENDALLQSWYQASTIEQDPTWCAQKQHEICNVKPTPSLNVVNNVTKDMLTLEFDHPTIEANTQGGANIVTASFVSYENNLFDVSTMIMAAKQVYCKMKSDEAIADTLNMTIPTQTISCAQLNQATLEQALSLVSSEAKARYYRRGAQLSMIGDAVETTGFGWTLANIAFNLTAPGMYTVQSPSLVSPQNTPFGLGGMHYCTLLSVARAVEWILVDSMKPNPSM